MSLQNDLVPNHRLETCQALATGLGHSLSNILEIISGHVALLERENSNLNNKDLLKDLQEIYQKAENAQNTARALSIITHAQVHTEEATDIHEAILEFKSVLQNLLSVEINLKLSLEAKNTVVAMGKNHIQILLLVLVNSAKNSIPQNGLLQIITSDINNSQELLFEISDNGKGLDHEIIDTLDSKEKAQKLGPAFEVAWSLTQDQKAKIKIESKPWQGTKFEITLPIAEKLTVNNNQDTNLSITEEQPQNACVLLVEDDHTLRSILKRVMQKSGFTILSAEDGVGALKILETHDGDIDILVSDVVMPKLGGVALYNAAKCLRPETKVIFMSGYSPDALIKRGNFASDVNFMQKPFSHKNLISKISVILNQPQAVKSKEI